MKKLLFVCVENSNRSQMAEAFAKMYGDKKVRAYSAGSRPGRMVNPKAVAAMNELGYDLSGHYNKSLEEVRKETPFDVLVMMGCGDICYHIEAGKYLEWAIPDPRDMDTTRFNEVRDTIGRAVKALVEAM